MKRLTSDILASEFKTKKYLIAHYKIWSDYKRNARHRENAKTSSSIACYLRNDLPAYINPSWAKATLTAWAAK